MTAGVEIPLVSGRRNDGPSLWCQICDETWPLPSEDDAVTSESVKVLNTGIDHLENVHGRKPPTYND